MTWYEDYEAEASALDARDEARAEASLRRWEDQRERPDEWAPEPEHTLVPPGGAE